jgi:hypothetical protein
VLLYSKYSSPSPESHSFPPPTKAPSLHLWPPQSTALLMCPHVPYVVQTEQSESNIAIIQSPHKKNQHFPALAFSLRFAYGSIFILLNKQYNPISQQIPLWSPLSHECNSAIQDKIYCNEISSQLGSHKHIPCLPVSNDKQTILTILFQRLISISSLWILFTKLSNNTVNHNPYFPSFFCSCQ